MSGSSRRPHRDVWLDLPPTSLLAEALGTSNDWVALSDPRVRKLNRGLAPNRSRQSLTGDVEVFHALDAAPVRVATHLDPERMRDVLELSVDTTGLRFVSFEAPYDHLAEQASYAVAKGNELAIALPAVGFIVDATLDLFERPEFARLLPQEVVERAEVATRAAEDVASYSVRSRLLRNFYQRSEHLQPFLMLGSIHNFMSLVDERYIGSQGGAPFREASTVAGGALRLLRARPEIAEDLTDILMRSVGLLAIANIPKPDADNDEGVIQEQKKRNQYLGFPYVKEGHLTVRHNPTEVRLTSRARNYTKQLARASEAPYSGCPARKVVSAQDPHTTVLGEYWTKIVRFLVPPGATVAARR